MIYKIEMFIAILLIIFAIRSNATAQSGGQFTIQQSVIANSGGSSSGGTFQVAGTNAQSLAGTRSTTSQFGLHGGFWNASQLAPSAATVSVSGKLLTADGRGIRNAYVVLTDGQGITRTALSSAFGYYRFDDVQVGNTYIVNVVSKRFFFVPRVLTVSEELTDLDLMATP